MQISFATKQNICAARNSLIWLSVIILCVGAACGPIAQIAIGESARARRLEAELANLDTFAERYNVDRLIERINAVPFDPEEDFSFAVWGDPRSNSTVFERLWKGIQNEDVLFAIATGDLVSRGHVRQWLEYFFPVIDKYNDVVFLPTIGNHDLGTDRMEYKRIFGRLDYTFDYANARFIVIDNNDGVSPEQLEWMDRLLETAGDRHKFVFAHKPPRTIEKWAYHSFSEGANSFCDLMSKHRVTTVFLGHIHAYSTAKYNGVDYVVTGGGGAGLHSRYGPMGNVHHYCVVHVGQTKVYHEVVRLIDGDLARSPGGNEFYQDPRELLPPDLLATALAIVPGATVTDVDIRRRGRRTFFEIELEERANGKDYRDVDTVIRDDGRVISVEREVFQNELPTAILSYISENYGGEQFDEAVNVQEGSDSWFEVTLVTPGGSERDLLFEPDGTFIGED